MREQVESTRKETFGGLGEEELLQQKERSKEFVKCPLILSRRSNEL
jgi:hypothetical protein